ncbi:MAG: NF038122 family metalloprotease [Luteolibacter sp.]
MKKVFLAAGVHLACLVPSHALNINLNAPGGIDPGALAGFQLAANYWQSKLADSVTVNINVDFSVLGPGILGSTGSSSLGFAVSDVMGALAFDAKSSNDFLAVSSFPSLSALGNLSFLTQQNTEGGSALVSLDNDDLADAYLGNVSTNNQFLALTSANARALGWDPGNSTYVDAAISFSSSFAWDFDPSNGIGAGLQDFVGVTIHEMGHALGFVSGVDDVDYFITNPADIDPYAVFTTLDLFRYSAPGTLDLGVGDASYFSIDGGVTSLGAFSTGSLENGGDGRQASHWKDNLGLGIMDPTANPAGQANTPTELDLTAFDSIGWDLVPEPSAAMLALAGAVISLARRRR